MGDHGASGGGRGLALSGYETKLVVAALCRYARAGNVHPGHRDSCERLAGTVAAEGSVTLELGPESARGAERGGGPLSSESSRTVTADVRGATTPDTGETTAVAAGTPTPDADGAKTVDASGAAPAEPRSCGQREAAEDPFRWGPDSADG